MRERKYARTQILESKEFLATAKFLSESIPCDGWALIGGLAVAHYANPPVTVDVDVLLDDQLCDAGDIIDFMKDEGWRYRPLFFASRMRGLPKKAVAFEKGERPMTIIDFLFTGKDKFLRSTVESARPMKLGNDVRIRVIRPENLIVMKSLAGRDKDNDDIADLYRKLGDSLDLKYITRQLEKLA